MQVIMDSVNATSEEISFIIDEVAIKIDAKPGKTTINIDNKSDYSSLFNELRYAIERYDIRYHGKGLIDLGNMANFMVPNVWEYCRVRQANYEYILWQIEDLDCKPVEDKDYGWLFDLTDQDQVELLLDIAEKFGDVLLDSDLYNELLHDEIEEFMTEEGNDLAQGIATRYGIDLDLVADKLYEWLLTNTGFYYVHFDYESFLLDLERDNVF